MADGEGQGHPLPEGAAGQLLRDVPPQRGAGEGAASAEGRQRRGREQRWDDGKGHT